jgi:hypothetical protein
MTSWVEAGGGGGRVGIGVVHAVGAVLGDQEGVGVELDRALDGGVVGGGERLAVATGK